MEVLRDWYPGESMEVPGPFLISCPSMHLFHLGVPELYPFTETLVISSLPCFSEFCELL